MPVCHIVSPCCADCRRPQETLHILTPEVDIFPMVGWCWDKKILISYLYKRTLTGNTHFKTRGNCSLQVVVQKHTCFNLPTAPEVKYYSLHFNPHLIIFLFRQFTVAAKRWLVGRMETTIKIKQSDTSGCRLLPGTPQIFLFKLVKTIQIVLSLYGQLCFYRFYFLYLLYFVL